MDYPQHAQMPESRPFGRLVPQGRRSLACKERTEEESRTSAREDRELESLLDL